eukprot:942387-Pyramimonas_sp.AAC.2
MDGSWPVQARCGLEQTSDLYSLTSASNSSLAWEHSGIAFSYSCCACGDIFDVLRVNTSGLTLPG